MYLECRGFVTSLKLAKDFEKRYKKNSDGSKRETQESIEIDGCFTFLEH